MKIHVVSCVYHRNGISGMGFYAINFTYEEEGKRESTSRREIATRP